VVKLSTIFLRNSLSDSHPSKGGGLWKWVRLEEREKLVFLFRPSPKIDGHIGEKKESFLTVFSVDGTKKSAFQKDAVFRRQKGEWQLRGAQKKQRLFELHGEKQNVQGKSYEELPLTGRRRNRQKGEKVTTKGMDEMKVLVHSQKTESPPPLKYATFFSFFL